MLELANPLGTSSLWSLSNFPFHSPFSLRLNPDPAHLKCLFGLFVNFSGLDHPLDCSILLFLLSESYIVFEDIEDLLGELTDLFLLRILFS